MTRPLVEITDLVKTFPVGRGMFRPPARLRAVDGVTLSIAQGGTLGLVGESGSGKSTLARCVLRLLEPDGGGIRLDGTDVRALRGQALRRFRRRMQVVFQDPWGSLNPRMRVGTAIREPLEIHGLARGAEAEARTVALLEEVGLDRSFAGRWPHELSGGQRQRVGIARALAPEPDFLVLDEPVSALDVSVQAQVLRLLRTLQERHGLTYLFIAHDLAVVRQMATRIAVMYLGRIVEEGPAAAVYRAPRHPYTASLLAAVPTPDPDAPPPRVLAAGDPPSPVHRPAGCAFHPRCPHPAKDARCTADDPMLREIEEGCWTACHYAEQLDEMRSQNED